MREYYFLTFIFLGLTFQVNVLQAQHTLLPMLEFENPDWYHPSSKILELPDGQLLVTYSSATKIFDGGKWNDVHSLSGINILSADIHKNELWVGLDYDFGVLHPIQRGEWEFASMKHILPDSVGVQNQIVGITSAGNYLFINTFQDTYIWDGNKVTVMSAKEVLSQALGKDADEYPRAFLNMAFSVDDKYLQEVRPYGFLSFEDGRFMIDSTYTLGLPKTVLFDLKKLKNGDLVAVSLAGIFKRKHGKDWQKYLPDIPEELLPPFFIQYHEYGDGSYIVQNEKMAYFLNKQGTYLFNSDDIPGFSSKGYLSLEITGDGVVWLPGEEDIVRLYPDMPIYHQNVDVYTQSEFGNPFLWQNDELIVTNAFNNFRFRKRKTELGLQLDTLKVYPGGDGAVLGVEQQGESIFFLYSNMIQEYREDTLFTESSLEIPINRYEILAGLEGTILVSMRNGIGLLERSDDNNWQQSLIYNNSDYSRISEIVVAGDQEFIGVTGNGEVFSINFKDSDPEIHPLYSLVENFGVSKANALVKIDNELIVFSDKGAFKSNLTNPDYWTTGAGVLSGLPEDVYLFGTSEHEERLYLYGRDSWGASFWEFHNEMLTNLPLGGLDQVHYSSIDPEGYVWVSSGSQSMWFDPDELLNWYDLKGTQLQTWIGGSLTEQNVLREGIYELPHNYESVILNAGFNSYFFPKKNRFRIRINDKSWGEWQAGSQFDLSFLTSGSYQVEIQGVSGLGQIHSSNPVMLKVNYPWYLTIVAIICYILLLSLILWFIVVRVISFRTNRIELRYKATQVDELNKMDRMKSRLLMNISHELKTPLTLTLAPLEQLRDELMTGEGKWEKPYEIAVRNGERLRELVNQVVDLARLDSENLVLNFEYVNATDFFELAVQSFESLATKKNLSLVFTSEAETIMAAFDKDKMQKVLTNLISNSIKFTPEQGEISVILAPLAEGFTVTVSDSGSGIEPERLPLIFDRFHTNTERTTGSGEGIGVGLSISKEYVLLHEGDIEVESEIDKGTTFKVRIPYNLNKAGKPVTEFKEEKEVMGEVKHELNTSGIKTVRTSIYPGHEVLLLEDNEDMRLYISSVLSRQGYQVIQKENGEAGLKQLVNKMPDIIITDLMMPGMDGLEFMKKMRGNIEFRGIPIIMLTALSGNYEKMQAFELGVSDYLLKPFREKELLVRVRNLIKLKQEREETLRNDTSPGKMSTDQNFIGKLRQFVIDNLDNMNLKTDDLSNTVNMSRRQFFRTIKIETGFTPAEFIKEVRMFEARNILQNQKNITISEVSNSVGIATPSYFVKLYKDHFGVHPKEHTI